MVSLLSILEIQDDEILVDFYQNKETNKFGYLIARNEDKHFRTILESQAIYDSKTLALEEGQNALDEIKAFDVGQELSNRQDKI